jgi:hypothetical protein
LLSNAQISKDVFKNPITASWKSSKKGRFENHGLVPVFKNGELLEDYSFDEIRKRAEL